MGTRSGNIKKASKPRSAEEASAKAAPTFNEAATAFTRTMYAILAGLKNRTGGAQDYGADGLFVCAVEALHTARASKRLEDYLKAAAYSLAAALKSSGAWDYPVVAPAEAEKPTKKAKAKTKKEGVK